MMNPLTHFRARRLVSAYVDGELEPARAMLVAHHVARCWGCSGDAEVVRLLKRSLSGIVGQRRDALATLRLQRFAARLTR